MSPTLPALVCQRRCQASCGPVHPSPIERLAILRATHRVVGPDHTGRRCRLLEPDGACAIYAHRPMVCRLFGLTEAMACPHGCIPERWLTEAEALDALAATWRDR